MVAKSNKKHRKSRFNSKKNNNIFENVLSTLAPKSFKSFTNCMMKKCNDVYQKYIVNSHYISAEVNKCSQKHKYKKDVKKCIKEINQMPIVKEMTDCRKKNCRKETKKINEEIKKTVKKYRNQIKKSKA
jgi:hypothetical protein